MENTDLAYKTLMTVVLGRYNNIHDKIERLHEDLMQSDPIKRKIIISDLYKWVNETREYASQAKTLQYSEGTIAAEGWEKTYEGYIAKIEKEAKRWGIELEAEERQEIELEPEEKQEIELEAKKSSKGRPASEILDFLLGETKEEQDKNLYELHTKIDGEKGRRAFDKLNAAVGSQLKELPTYPAFNREFGDKVNHLSQSYYSQLYNDFVKKK